ncbi:MAG TPA: hypothetical protein VK633_03310 [Verrucomicrobiae bacterium]|nr:hypothetical protein [Verrucomicrobiae bacterium]
MTTAAAIVPIRHDARRPVIDRLERATPLAFSWFIGLGLAFLGTIAPVASVRADYLPRIGPSSMRFQSDVSTRPLALLLPGYGSTNNLLSPTASIAKTNEVARAPLNLAITNLAVIDPVPTFTVNSDPATWTEDMVTSPGTIGGPTTQETAKQSDIVTPQMMLHFFQRRPSGLDETGVSLPMTFVPPVSAELPSSKATYNSP